MGTDRGDIGRRVALRREELGLTRKELAARAGVAPGYLQYVEEHSAVPDIGGLLQLAGALDTTVPELLGGHADQPPGTGMAAMHPALLEMDQRECRAHLSTHGVGRVAVSTDEGPVILPVNYTVLDDEVAFRTEPGHTLANAAGTEVAFEVDHIDEALSQGWSVLIVGHADQVTDPEGIHRLDERSYSMPWAGGERDVWIRISPERLTGRRIHVD